MYRRYSRHCLIEVFNDTETSCVYLKSSGKKIYKAFLLTANPMFSLTK